MHSLFVNNLTVIDFSYFHPQRGIVGESLILDVELFGELNDEGMLFDFSFVKKRIKSCVDNLVDHKFLIPSLNRGVKWSQSSDQLTLELTAQNGDLYQHVSPSQAIYMINSDAVSPQSIASEIEHEINEILPSNVTSTKINLRAEKIDGSYYHYSHGLKKHSGDCQRIAHGHRSKIQVWVNDEYSTQWSEHIVAMWQDIYLATEEDIKGSQIIDNTDYWIFEYHANQGDFQLTLPKNRCYLIKTDTTAELIAAYLANYLKSKIPNSKITVRAYEGVDKGAVSVVE